MPRTRSLYQDQIRLDLANQGLVGQYDPRHVEAYMRLEHSTLDGLDQRQFWNEVATAVECINIGGVDDAEALAQSYGL